MIFVKDYCFVSDQKTLPSLTSSRKRKTSPLVKEKEVTKKALSLVTQTPGRRTILSNARLYKKVCFIIAKCN